MKKATKKQIISILDNVSDETLHVLQALPKAARKDLVDIMARVSERAYRRGAQHGAEFSKIPAVAKQKPMKDILRWRFQPLDKSPGLDGYTTSSRERLLLEEPIAWLMR